ncbi:hydrolase [Oscillatoriales cyanobacterium LEGE 11467]|uniref:Hydrolase n=1 Tax=Zarconia navalis LEGE 11467 TaxID=1828826 RepID=A0A928VWP1_9CYAN|nr:hydrolase [Zarconia navalis]MBE9041622.1 hydrolase [Zarconia navalis LEGE 11467]
MAESINIPLLNADECALLLIDHEPQMFFGVQSHDRQTIVNNVVGLAKGAKLFGVPTILTTVTDRAFSGPIVPEIQAVFPDHKPIARTSMNSWEDENLRKAVEKTGKRKLVMAALWTEVCLTFPALSALANGYEVYFVTDASGAFTKEVHERSVQRLIQAGGVPMTWQQTILEWQRDWANQETYEGMMDIIQEHSGAYGMGIFYAKTMVQSYPDFKGFPDEGKVEQHGTASP